jgi:hypothetical protein
MAIKYGFLTVKSTGHVLSIFSMGKPPDTPPPTSSLVTDRLLVRDADTGDVAAGVAADAIETVLLDAPADAVVSPRSYRIEKDPADPNRKIITLQAGTVSNVVLSTSAVSFDLSLASAVPLKVWVQVESFTSPRVLNAEGSFLPAGATNTVTVPLSIPRDTYNVVAVVEKHALIAELNASFP